MKKNLLLTLGMAAMVLLSASAQNVTIKGVVQKMRTDDNEDITDLSVTIGSVFEKDGQYTANYMYGQDGWNYVGYVTVPAGGVMAMKWDGKTLSAPVQDPAFTKEAIVDENNNVNWEKAQTAKNLRNMVANSGAIYVDGKIVTVMSRDYQSTEDDQLFAVRKWDAKTCALLNDANEFHDVSSNIESAGMSYNPKDGKVYGLFHFTQAQLNEEILNDPDYITDQDDEDWGREGLDDGYAIGTIDLATMKVTPITPGLYYENFVTFAINSEGRAFALTSGGSGGYLDDKGKLRNADNELVGAQPIEFDLKTGLMIRNSKTIYEGTDSAYISYTYPYKATGYSSQFQRQSACFAKSNPFKMYWIGYYNSGKGINDWGSNGPLSDKEWKTNHKYDTALYELDLMTGDCQRVALITNRMSFSALWIDGDDNSDGTNYYETVGIKNVTTNTRVQASDKEVYNLQGVKVNANARGLQIVREGNKVTKKMVR